MNSHAKYDPMASPIPIHIFPIPHRKMDPGNPISSHPLMSDACADMAVTYGFSVRPPRI